jgi:hypothetical protein
MAKASSVKTGTAYEKFVTRLMQTIVDDALAKGIKPIVVEHNPKPRKLGRSGCRHQIDVYYEVQFAGETFSVAVECKKFKSSISIGRVRDFWAVLQYININKGKMYTAKGFQSGALKFAAYHNIRTEVIDPSKPLNIVGGVI